MTSACPHCGKVMEFSGSAPLACGSCGQALAQTQSTSTVDFVPDAESGPSPKPGAVAGAEAPQTVGPYRLLRCLGSGGMGSVFEAEEPGSGRHVAIKMLAPGSQLPPEALERFRQEGRLASGIAHPRCVFVLAVGEDAGRPYIVMELMPGSTLKDLVEKEGPLSPEQAVTKILDVIEGVQQAHRLGLIHRDIKPSNCFLEANGRVKIGDFGLAKSLESDLHLTQPGAFLGTPLFASPEQIRKDSLGPQTDVYSVAATLYYLLTGRAPFQGADAAATMARIVADPVPSMRTIRPGLPPALDKAVLRGLERNRNRRWRDLEEFRQALLPFLPSQLSIAGMGLRTAAYLLDSVILGLVGVILVLVFFVSGSDITTRNLHAHTSVLDLLGLFIAFVYFLVSESVWGCSLGKRWLRLRVCTLQGSDIPRVGNVFIRVLTFLVLVNLGDLITVTVRFKDDPEELRQTFAGLLGRLIGWGAVLSTMRAHSGYRGPHEYLSGTRVVQLPWLPRRRSLDPRDAKGPSWHADRPAGLPPRIGPYAVQGALVWGPSHKVLLGQDPNLNRTVWIWMRPASLPPLPSGRRETQALTRLRWLAGGRDATEQWDAFLAPSGQPLQRAVEDRHPLGWNEVRGILEELSDELARCVRDGTLPDPLSIDQVWIDASGHVQLLDFAWREGNPDPVEAWEQQLPQKALSFLHCVAALALEGRLRPPGDTTPPIRAPIPLYASRLLSPLRQAATPYESVDEFGVRLRECHARPAAISRQRRLSEILLKGFAGYLAFAVFLSFTAFEPPRWLAGWMPELSHRIYAYLAAFMVATVFWVFVFKGGLWLRVFDMALVNAHGQPVSRLRCAWRTALMWLAILAPTGLLIGFYNAIQIVVPKAASLEGLPLEVGFGGGVFLSAVAAVAFAVWSPSRSLHDCLAGTYLVPR